MSTSYIRPGPFTQAYILHAVAIVPYLQKKCTISIEYIVYLDSHVRGLRRVTVWFQQLAEL
jgi:hypothetical protein